ncbi:hypothetical protein COT94_00640 [Candidatus Falkowbacteria bacterium CG10_big_fil_rev_8_21_14_0_10_37_14]|uniref:Type II secretion system protein GspG C-terminal domain-containing protein n=1 Tax=Candidatus Falkowbacteria bacterium CG10_big_fil_rev_8_21_14_0_10_37_14 TaxID=1974561 RepID=A0A2M6WUH3_9BACT|nr:type II secretion system protein [Candidatus Falkowbacteria bacterium]PIT96455.1 MAG: hypothetical protein COT94_00640 [Candidatus Falkowbacteria bacterium CG10_big_fil_rev_8_21_14_0_10_37_14]
MKKTGFTILELLLAIVIMSILTALTVKTLSSLRMANRDGKRITDIRLIQGALESFYRDVGMYPTTITAGSPLSYSLTTYLPHVPFNPQPVDNGCTATTTYTYSQDENGASYSLSFCLGNKTSDVGAGANTAVPGDIVTCLPNCFMSCNTGVYNGVPNTGADGCGGVCTNVQSCPTNYTCLDNHCLVD